MLYIAKIWRFTKPWESCGYWVYWDGEAWTPTYQNKLLMLKKEAQGVANKYGAELEGRKIWQA